MGSGTRPVQTKKKIIMIDSDYEKNSDCLVLFISVVFTCCNIFITVQTRPESALLVIREIVYWTLKSKDWIILGKMMFMHCGVVFSGRKIQG